MSPRAAMCRCEHVTGKVVPWSVLRTSGRYWCDETFAITSWKYASLSPTRLKWRCRSPIW